MPTNLYNLRDQVLALEPDERANLLALIEHENASAPFVPGREDLELWEVIGKLCQHNPGKLTSFVGDKRNGISKSAWHSAVKELYQFVGQAQPVRHAQQDATALLAIVLDALACDLRQRQIEITPKTMLAALPRLRLAVDDCYPGYLEAGMLHRLIRVAT